MKVFLDSTYFFPLIQVNIKGVDSLFLKKLTQKKEFNLFYSPITIFEMSAKGAKLIMNDKITSHEVKEGINSLLNWKDLQQGSPWIGEIQNLAFQFRETHSDYIDCLIVASAVFYSDTLITEDHLLTKYIKNEWKISIKKLNENFKVNNSKIILKP